MKVWRWVKREFFHVLPAFIFFFVSFNLINIVEGMILRQEGIPPYTLLTVFVASLVVAKVLLIVDHLPFINPFRKFPLIYNTLWKVFLYGTTIILFRFIDRYVHFLWAHPSEAANLHTFLANIHWVMFWVVTIWYELLFFVFVVSRELITALGPAKVRRLFFGG